MKRSNESHNEISFTLLPLRKICRSRRTPTEQISNNDFTSDVDPNMPQKKNQLCNILRLFYGVLYVPWIKKI